MCIVPASCPWDPLYRRGIPHLSRKDKKKTKEEIMILLAAKKYMNCPRQRASNGNPQKYKGTRQKTWLPTRWPLTSGASRDLSYPARTWFAPVPNLYTGKKLRGGALNGSGGQMGEYCKMRDLHFLLVLEDRWASKSTRPPIWGQGNLLGYSGPDATSLN